MALVIAAGSSIGPAQSASLTLGMVRETITAYPTAFGDINPLAIGDCLEGLVTEDAAANVIPGQAQSWAVSPDGLRYVFTLRDGFLWSNGDAVVAQDFVAGFQWLFDPANAVGHANLHFFIRNAAGVYEGLADRETLGVVALDDRTVQIDLERPVPYLLQTLAHPSAYPLPSRQIAEHGAAWLQPDNVICNGPFTITHQGEAVTEAEKSPLYHDADAVAVDSVDYLVLDDLDTALSRYEAGEIDALYDLPGRAADWIAANRPDEGRITPFAGLNYYVLNLDKPPLDDPALRRALAMAVDREQIDLQQMHSRRSIAYGIVPPGLPNAGSLPPSVPDWADWPADRRLVEARRILADRGYGPDNPLSLTIRYNVVGDDAHQDAALAIANMWARIGVETRLLDGTIGEHFAALETGNFDVGRSTWILDFPDPADILELLRTGSELNLGGYSNPQFDALLDRASAATDPEVRRQLLAQAEALAIADTAVIPLSWILVQNLVAGRVSGVVENVRNVHLSRWISLAD